ncbi:hypothetical protein tb265_09060 [Gemmatimonadetes bacterium T265]|nr:hypothetical protein tb265_09060 [Gemmatimonadetes bacterium T265]
MDGPRDTADCKSIDDLRALWRERYERVRVLRERWREADLGLSRMTRPPRDPDERAFLEQHGGLSPFREKPNPPWAKGWPPRNPDRPLTDREKFFDAINEAWRTEPIDDERPDPDAAVPRPDTLSDAAGPGAPASLDGVPTSGDPTAA